MLSLSRPPPLSSLRLFAGSPGQAGVRARPASGGGRYRRSARDVGGSNAIRPGGYVLLAVPVVTFGLGVWQTKRRRWKLDLLSDLEERTSAPVVPLPDDLGTVSDDLEYRKVSVRGRFDHAKETFIGPKSRVLKDDGGGGGLFGSSEGVGYLVVTPFQLSCGGTNEGKRILVNRGWVPKGRTDPKTRLKGQIQGEVDLVGVVRRAEVRQQFAPKNQASSNMWMHRDIDALASFLETQPVFVDADADSTVPGGPIGGQTRVTMRNDHLEYMITWYSLSAATLYMWLKKFVIK